MAKAFIGFVLLSLAAVTIQTQTATVPASTTKNLTCTDAIVSQCQIQKANIDDKILKPNGTLITVTGGSHGDYQKFVQCISKIEATEKSCRKVIYVLHVKGSRSKRSPSKAKKIVKTKSKRKSKTSVKRKGKKY